MSAREHETGSWVVHIDVAITLDSGQKMDVTMLTRFGFALCASQFEH